MADSVPPAVLDRARGAWLGQIVGDALGTTLEFKSPARIAQDHPGGLRRIVGGGPFRVLPGQITDDTELALALARSLDERGGYEPDAVAAAYVAWYRSGPFDVGGTIGAAFGGRHELGPGLAARVAHRASRTSQANGSVMRLAALPIWGWHLPAEELAALAAFDARLSHPHEVCQAANVIQAHAIGLAIREGTDPRATWSRTLQFARAHPLCVQLVPPLEAAETAAPADFVTNMGWVKIALQNAFYRLLHASSLEEGLVDTVMQGGDTDTNACIAGALLGAVHGERAIPPQWREAVLSCHTSRGPAYQTTDARELAARLAEAGLRAPPLPDLELGQPHLRAADDPDDDDWAAEEDDADEGGDWDPADQDEEAWDEAEDEPEPEEVLSQEGVGEPVTDETSPDSDRGHGEHVPGEGPGPLFG